MKGLCVTVLSTLHSLTLCPLAIILVGGFGTRLRPLVRRPSPRRIEALVSQRLRTEHPVLTIGRPSLYLSHWSNLPTSR